MQQEDQGQLKEKRARSHLRSLGLFIITGMLMFLGVMLAVNMLIVRAAGPSFSDASILDFYPLMGGAGALFGFELWWSHEQGPYNPFHESRTA